MSSISIDLENNMLEDFIDENDNELFTNDEDITKWTQLIAIFDAFLGCSMLDLDKFIAGTIDIRHIRRNETDEIELTTASPCMNRRIQDLSDSRCCHDSRFSKEQLEALLDLMFGRTLRGACK